MKYFIERNKKYFENLDFSDINLEQKNIFLETFNKNKIIFVRWFSSKEKINFISYIIKNSNLKNDYLYINKELDLDNILKNNNSLEFFLRHIEDFYKKPKVIILENIDSIKNIEKFIDFLEKEKIKIIILSNTLKIKEKNILYWYFFYKNKLNNFYKNINKKYKKLESENIIYKNIIEKYNLKNIDLYKYTLIFLAKNNKIKSIREINRNLNKVIKISLTTMMEYIKYSLEQFLIKQIFVFDFKKNKIIETKTKFYFYDTIFRNSLYNFELSENILKQNHLFNILKQKNYKIFSWINWTYEFDFYWVSNNNSILNSFSLQEKEATNISTIFIDFAKSTEKKEIKKQINKLLKVPQIIAPLNPLNKGNMTQTFEKYLILDNARNLWFTKLQYENLKIVSFEEMIEILNKK